jgi:hypothetical protein
MSRDLAELDRQIDHIQVVVEAKALAEASYSPENGYPKPEFEGRDWDQDVWVNACGAFGCLAGNTVLDAGWVYAGLGLVMRPENPSEKHTVDSIAIKLLGLTEQEGSAFFDGNNSLEVLRALQADLHEGREVFSWSAGEYQRDLGDGDDDDDY